MAAWIEVLYVPCALLFIFSILGLSKQETARPGNLYGVIGMTAAIVALYFHVNLDLDRLTEDVAWVIMPVVLIVGGVIGVWMAHVVAMTGMPQMVGLLNAFGGLAAAVEAISLYFSRLAEVNLGADFDNSATMSDWFLSHGESVLQMAFLQVGIVVGIITFVGSIIACYKLSGKIGNPKKWSHLFNLLLIVLIVVCMALAGLASYQLGDDKETPPAILHDHLGMDGWPFIVLLVLLSGVYGWAFVYPIGGADMPVVISVLNSFSGMSGCTAGFMLKNNLLIITGALVASSGSILSYIMCKAMNRSLLNVMAGGFGEASTAGPAKASADDDDQEVDPIETEEVTDRLLAAKRVVIVPGYGMAVAQAQHAVANVTNILRKRGVEVIFGIHPVAGRLPGHMNVLLAEASVPYDIVLEMDEVNPGLPDTDVVLVIGANDTVNPAAEEDPDSPIAGMPVIRVWESDCVIVMKRSMRRGYAAVPNPLFFMDCTRMYFGDAKKNMDAVVVKLSQAKELEGGDVAIATKKVEEVVEDFTDCPVYKKIGIPKEVSPGETRIAMTPDVIPRMRKLGFAVLVEAGAGAGASYRDEEFVKAGGQIVDSASVWTEADIIQKINMPTEAEMEYLRENQVLVSYMRPREEVSTALKTVMRNRKVTGLAMDAVPRTTAAQKLDSLSSMGKIAGYRSVIEAANNFERFFTNQITAAGKYPPARVLVIGAGVAGLEALGVARALGADVRCFDTRAVCKEQVESMGGTFLEVKLKEDGDGAGGYAKVMSPEFIKAEMELFLDQAKEVDIIITTAAIPGRPAPKLIKEYHVDAMKTGSVIVDLAAMTGGNCDLTEKDKVVNHNGVRIVGYVNLPTRMARQSSQMYAMNMFRLAEHMKGAKDFVVDVEDAVIRPMMVAHEGDIVYEPPAAPVATKRRSSAALRRGSISTLVKTVKAEDENAMTMRIVGISTIAILTLVFALWFPESFSQQLMVFALACIVGYNSIWNVTAALHTPLMSVSNAISGVVLLGGMVQILGEIDEFSLIFGTIAVLIGAINVFGGFYVTHRMLQMFVIKRD